MSTSPPAQQVALLVWHGSLGSCKEHSADVTEGSDALDRLTARLIAATTLERSFSRIGRQQYTKFIEALEEE